MRKGYVSMNVMDKVSEEEEDERRMKRMKEKLRREGRKF